MHRICYPSMKHSEGDVIKPRDCIIVASGHRKKDLPFIAKVTAIWEDPDDGESEIIQKLKQIKEAIS